MKLLSFLPKLYFILFTLLIGIVVGIMAGNIPNLRQEEDEFLYDVFPEDFQWGLAVSAYQTEGAFDVDGNT